MAGQKDRQGAACLQVGRLADHLAEGNLVAKITVYSMEAGWSTTGVIGLWQDIKRELCFHRYLSKAIQLLRSEIKKKIEGVFLLFLMITEGAEWGKAKNNETLLFFNRGCFCPSGFALHFIRDCRAVVCQSG